MNVHWELTIVTLMQFVQTQLEGLRVHVQQDIQEMVLFVLVTFFLNFWMVKILFLK